MSVYDRFHLIQTAVEGFGAFVSFGAEKDGLVHISQVSVSSQDDE